MAPTLLPNRLVIPFTNSPVVAFTYITTVSKYHSITPIRYPSNLISKYYSIVVDLPYQISLWKPTPLSEGCCCLLSLVPVYFLLSRNIEQTFYSPLKKRVTPNYTVQTYGFKSPLAIILLGLYTKKSRYSQAGFIFKKRVTPNSYYLNPFDSFTFPN
jgi:hypothetical protein